MSEIKYPRYLNNAPDGEDKYDGGSQKKLVGAIREVILNNQLEHKIIGLEGSWGSGKSNVIEALKKDEHLKKHHHVFVYDAWGNQEELTRRSFLSLLTEELLAEKLLNEENKWTEKLNILLGNSTTTHISKFPLFKLHVFFIILAAVLIPLLTSFYTFILADLDISPNYYLPYNWKPFLVIFTLPLTLFGIGIYFAIKEYYNLGKKTPKDSTRRKVEKLLSWYFDKDLESTIIQNAKNKDASLSEFREYYSEIENEVKENGFTLVVVFDNLDRLDELKIKSLWSSIHTFFAEPLKRDTFQSWVIVPYNYKEIKKTFSDASKVTGFIDKTFAVKFHVSPAVVSDVDKLLNEYLIEAFGTKILRNDDKHRLISIFNGKQTELNNTPRQIKNYVNFIVSMYLRWKDSLSANRVKFKHLGLYYFLENNEDFKDNPTNYLLKQEFLIGAQSHFLEDQDLIITFASLTFGIEHKDAEQVLFGHIIKNSLVTGNTQYLEEILSSKSFATYFLREFESLKVEEICKTFPNVYYKIAESVNTLNLNEIIHKYSYEISNSAELSDNFYDYHEFILLEASEVSKRIVLEKIILNSYHQAVEGPDDYQTHYIGIVLELEKFLRENHINIDIEDYLQEIYVTPFVLLDLLRETSVNYKKYKIKTANLDQYYLDEWNVRVDVIFEDLNELSLLNAEYDLTNLLDSVRGKLAQLKFNEVELFEKCLTILFKLEKKKPIQAKLSVEYYKELRQASLGSNNRQSYLNAYSIAISDFKNAKTVANFIYYLNQLDLITTKEIAEKILQFMRLQSLLRTALNNQDVPKLKEISALCLEQDSNSYIDVAEIINNFDEYCSQIFNNNPDYAELLFSRIEARTYAFHAERIIIDQQFSSFILNRFNRENSILIKLVRARAAEYISNLSEDSWRQLLFNFQNSKDFEILEALVQSRHKIIWHNNFYSAYREFLLAITTGSTNNVPTSLSEFWSNLDEVINGLARNSIWIKIRDAICLLDTLSTVQLQFLTPGVLKYGRSSVKAAQIGKNVIIPIITDLNLVEEYVLNEVYFPKIVDVIDKSEDTKQEIINKLEEVYLSGQHADNGVMFRYAERYGFENSADGNEHVK